MSLPLALYRAASGLLQPLAPGLLQGRARRGKEDAARLSERLGYPGRPRPPGSLIWLHGVSVGESLSLIPLVEGLAARRPEATLLVTSSTLTSASLLAQRLPKGAIHHYSPIDSPAAVGRFLDHWRPDLGLLVESELWPNLILTAAKRGVKLALVSARMTEASARGWRRGPGAARKLLSAFDLVLPQSDEIAERLGGLGATISGRLNLKRIGRPLPHDPQILSDLRGTLAPRPIVLASNTHPGEEEIVARAMAGLDATLVVAPRHPDRGTEVASLLAALGFVVAQRSLGQTPTPETTAYVADTLGEMGLFYRLSDIAVMGGSFVPGIGGHNPLEPARLKVPIISGPDVFNAADLYAEMHADVAAIEAKNGADLARHLAGMLKFPHIAERIAGAAQAYADRQGAALDDALDALDPLMPR